MITLTEDDLVNGLSEANGAYIARLSALHGHSIGQLVEFPTLTASRFRLLCQSVDADNYSGPWITELVMLDESQVALDEDWGGG